ncbi:hypothetical protein SNEBB_005749 [Seison nebaliae]|nr:hypothetical protein SNEBB_005749 [Seison nebaliae]
MFNGGNCFTSSTTATITTTTTTTISSGQDKRINPHHVPSVANDIRKKFRIKKGRRQLDDELIANEIKELAPNVELYQKLLRNEMRLNRVIMKKKLDIQESIQMPMKIKRILEILITTHFHPEISKTESKSNEEKTSEWELKIEGKLLDDDKFYDSSKNRRKFSSYFKNLVIELDEDLYGPDNHLVEWQRQTNKQETDGFQVRRSGDQDSECIINMNLNYQPQQYELDPRLSNILGIDIATRQQILHCFWIYVKEHKLYSTSLEDVIHLDENLREIFEVDQMKLAEIPNRLFQFLASPPSKCIKLKITLDPNNRTQTSTHQLEVEIEEPSPEAKKDLLYSQTNTMQIEEIDNEICEKIENINEMFQNYEFFNQYSLDPIKFIREWIMSQNKDLEVLNNLDDWNGKLLNELSRSKAYQEDWVNDALNLYLQDHMIDQRKNLENIIS